MSLQTMPGDILLGILNYVFYWDVGFKQRFYILAVFQQLRAAALPKVYNHMCITYIKPKVYNSQIYDNECHKTSTGYFNTNADLIALANCTHMVKSATIQIHGVNTTYAEIYNTIEALKSFAGLWPKITKLDIYINHKVKSCNTSKTLAMQPHLTGKEYSQQLATIMPGITELKLTSNHNATFIRDFYSEVIGAYAGQLVKLTNKNDFVYTVGHKLEVMQHLYVHMSNKFKTLPPINCHTLVSLRIANIPYNVLWTPFMDSEDDTVIEFSCLKKLHLEFINEDINQTSANKPELLLKFPSLSSRTIKYSFKETPFFKMAVFPEEMKYIYTEAPL